MILHEVHMESMKKVSRPQVAARECREQGAKMHAATKIQKWQVSHD